jgi:tetratricopeptide (TPR) repeat protein
VVFTDGEDHDSLAGTLAAAHTLGRTGVRLILVAEGQGNPARIPVRDSAGVLLQYQQETDGHVIETSRRDDVLQAIADAAEGTLVPAALPDQAGAVRDLVASFKRAPSQETTSADLLPKSWVPMLAALAALLVHTFTRRSAALVALAGLLVAPRLGAQVPSKGEAASAAGQPVEAAKAFLADAGAGVAADTAYYNAGTAALRAGQFDVARKALDKATHSIDPDLRYRALYNLGVTQLQAAARDSVHRATLLSEASQALQDALLIAPDSPRAKWNLELARRRRPPPPSSAGGGPPPPQPKGGESNSPTGQAPPVPSLSQNQAEQILNSVEREERDTRLKHSAHTRFATPPIKDW